MMIWSFMRKRHPDGSLDKYQARLWCHGGHQQWGVNYWDTCAPVVSWSSVRILMTLSKLHNLHTKLVDFPSIPASGYHIINKMLKNPDKLEFVKAMDKEVSSLFDKQI